MGGGQCEEPGCDTGLVDCGGYCCNAGDRCAGNGQCEPQGCDDGELDCGGGVCCPSGTRCSGGGCQPIPQGGSGGSFGGGVSTGSCDEAAIRMALGGFSSGNGCVDGCINNAIRCAGANGCVLTSACQNAEISCVQGCFRQ
jgi:hypothetical protein